MSDKDADRPAPMAGCAMDAKECEKFEMELAMQIFRALDTSTWSNVVVGEPSEGTTSLDGTFDLVGVAKAIMPMLAERINAAKHRPC